MSKQKLIAIFPGSFDPFTNGHADIVQRAKDIFDEVIIAVLNNSTKKTLFTVKERVSFITDAFKKVHNVSTESFKGLLVDYAKSKGNCIIIRGIRATTDYEYEQQMALMNRHLSQDRIETLFMMSKEETSYISSTIVKQVASLKGDVSKLIPKNVLKELVKKYR